MTKRYALVHKEDGEVLRLSDAPPAIDGDVVRFPDGEVRGVKWEKIRVAEIDCDHDLPDPTPPAAEEEGPAIRLRLDPKDPKIWIGDKAVPATVSYPTVGATVTAEDRAAVKAELVRVFLEKVLKTAYPFLWDAYRKAVTQIDEVGTYDELNTVLEVVKGGTRQ